MSGQVYEFVVFYNYVVRNFCFFEETSCSPVTVNRFVRFILFLYTTCVICTASETRRQSSGNIYSCACCFFQFRAIWRSLKFGMFASSSGNI